MEKIKSFSLKDGQLVIALDGCMITLQSSFAKDSRRGKSLNETPCKKRKGDLFGDDTEFVSCTPFPGILNFFVGPCCTHRLTEASRKQSTIALNRPPLPLPVQSNGLRLIRCTLFKATNLRRMRSMPTSQISMSGNTRIRSTPSSSCRLFRIVPTRFPFPHTPVSASPHAIHPELYMVSPETLILSRAECSSTPSCPLPPPSPRPHRSRSRLAAVLRPAGRARRDPTATPPPPPPPV